MFQTVECVVAYSVDIDYLGGDGNTIVRRETLGLFATKHDAEQVLVDEGFKRTSWGCWYHASFMSGHAQRVLIERK